MAESNITTLEHLKMLAVREKAYSGEHISALAALMAAGLEDAQHIGITITLPAASWEDKAQTAAHESLLADSGYWYFVYGDLGINADDISVDRQITFQCETEPDADLIVSILRLPVETASNSNVGKVFNLTTSGTVKTYIDGQIAELTKHFYGLYSTSICDSDSKAILDSDVQSYSD